MNSEVCGQRYASMDRARQGRHTGVPSPDSTTDVPPGTAATQSEWDQVLRAWTEGGPTGAMSVLRCEGGVS